MSRNIHISVHEAAKQLSTLITEGQPVTITRYGKPVATLLPGGSAQMDEPIAVAPTHRPVTETLIVTNLPSSSETQTFHSVTLDHQAQAREQQAARDRLLTRK